MKKINKIYKDWRGEYHTTNSGFPLHDSAEMCDFAEYYHKIRNEEFIKNRVIEIDGCYNCFFCSIEDITKNYFCSISPVKNIKITMTPKWCPLKKSNIVFKLNT